MKTLIKIKNKASFFSVIIVIAFVFCLANISSVGSPSTSSPSGAKAHSASTNDGTTQSDTDKAKFAPHSSDKGSIIEVSSQIDADKFIAVNNLDHSQIKKLGNNLYLVSKVINQLNITSGIVAYPNREYKKLLTPNDPLYAQAWHLPQVSAPEAWNIATGNASTTVAVIDTGFALDHEDLNSQWASNGYDFVCNDNSPQAGDNDCDKSINSAAATHGTLTAGLIGAATNNAVGTSSLNWNIKILPLQALSDDGSGSTAEVSAAIEYAVAQGAKVINMSLGSASVDSYLRQRIDNARAAGVLVVAAAGNCGDPSSFRLNGCNYLGQVLEPANYSPVLAVGATDSNDNRAIFSSYGSSVDIVAPGVNNLSTAWGPGNQTGAYASGSGTSFSAPIISSAAALIKSIKTDASQNDIENYIKTGATKVDGMFNQEHTDAFGYGRLNMYNALRNYSWKLETATVQVSQTNTNALDLNNLSPGQEAWVKVSARNTGTTTWLNSGSNPVRIATEYPKDRASSLTNSSWLSPARAANLSENSVAPGEVGLFEFPIAIPYGLSKINERFNLVVEGITWMNDNGLILNGNVNSSYQLSYVSQYAYSDSSKAVGIDLNNLSPGKRFYYGAKLRNTGTATWYNRGKYPIRLGNSNPRDRKSPFFENSWLGPGRVTVMQEEVVAPGEIATFEAYYTTPTLNGRFSEYHNLVAEGITWMNDIGIYFTGNINSTYSWALTDQYAYTDANKTTGVDPSNLGRNQTILIGFKARNTGTATWYNNGAFPVRVGTSKPFDRASAFCHGSWLGCWRPAAMAESSVAPGQEATFEFLVTTPNNPGTYNEYFTPMVEGYRWLQDIGLYYNFRVN